MGGTQQQQQQEAPTMLTTFTIFTTQASTQLSWLHTRMPLILSTTNTADAALQWIHKPSSELLQKLLAELQQQQHPLAWYPVTQKMNSSSYKGYDCMDPISLGTTTTPSIKSFFTSSKVPSIQESPSSRMEKKQEQAHSSITHHKTTVGFISSHGQLKKRKSVITEEEQEDEVASTTTPFKKEKHYYNSHDVPPRSNLLLSPRYSDRSQSRSANNMTIKKKTNTHHKTIQSFFVTKAKPF
jgi:hypothetical protein